MVGAYGRAIGQSGVLSFSSLSVFFPLHLFDEIFVANRRRVYRRHGHRQGRSRPPSTENQPALVTAYSAARVGAFARGGEKFLAGTVARSRLGGPQRAGINPGADETKQRGGVEATRPAFAVSTFPGF